MRVGIPCIAAAGAWAGCGTAGSMHATATRSSPRIATGTVPCPQPGPAHSPSLWSRLIPKEILFPAAGDPRGGRSTAHDARHNAYSAEIADWALGKKRLGTACSSQVGALGEFWGADLLPGDHPHPCIQLFSQELHCTSSRQSCRFSPTLTSCPSSIGQALLGARTSPGELNPLLSLRHLFPAGVLHRTQVFSLCCGGEQ